MAKIDEYWESPFGIVHVMDFKTASEFAAKEFAEYMRQHPEEPGD